ncbi:hypothetical protein [Algiphilus aromaticivorans]|uniref:hypothetical protein n=1 Tax=Algiphilus aromaticivorans TaxID=382454 RepID=UPI0005C133A3|nr:hypothetical protein [Algiphilus aromaticivorans]
MSKARQELEATLDSPEAFSFLDLVPVETVEAIARRTESRLVAERQAVDTAVEAALPRLPGWLRGSVRALLTDQS